MKRICGHLNILIPDDLSDKELKLHLYTKVSEDHRDEAKEFIIELKKLKKEIISESEANPEALKIWL